MCWGRCQVLHALCLACLCTGSLVQAQGLGEEDTFLLPGTLFCLTQWTEILGSSQPVYLGHSSACTKSQAEAMAGLEHKCSSFNLGHIVIYFSYTFHILRPPHTPSGIDSLGLQGAGGSPRNQVPQIITKMAVSKLHPRSVAEQPRLQGEESESQRSIGTHGRCQLLVQGFPCSGEQKCRAWLPSPPLPRPSWPWPSALLPAAALDCQWWVDLPSSGHDRHLGSEP